MLYQHLKFLVLEEIEAAELSEEVELHLQLLLVVDTDGLEDF